MGNEIQIIDIINFSTGIAGAMLMFLGLLLSVSSEYMERWMRRYFVVFFLLMTVYVASNLTSQAATLFWNPIWIGGAKGGMFVESLVSSMLLPLITHFLLRCAGVDWRRSRILYSVLLTWAMYVVLLVVTQFTTVIYYFTDDGVYHRGIHLVKDTNIRNSRL